MAFKQDVFFAVDAAVGGVGTAASPYTGPENNDTWFDTAMGNVLANQTVRLGPGVFQTKGNTSNGAGLAMKSGMRILGSGVRSTTLKLSNPDLMNPLNPVNAAALGMPSLPFAPLMGWEASDFTIDCAFTGTAAVTAGNRAIFVYGSHIYCRRLRVINFGGNVSGILPVIQIATIQSEDCVVEECSIETPSSRGSSNSVLVVFGGNTSQPHRFCAVRDCFLGTELASLPANLFGIAPGSAVGFIAEGNQLRSLHAGIYDLPGTENTPDIIIRNNYMRKVSEGVYYNRAYPVGRIIVHDNIIEIASSIDPLLADRTGIRLLGTVAPFVTVRPSCGKTSFVMQIGIPTPRTPT